MSLNQQIGLAHVGIKTAMRYRWEAIAVIITTPITLIIYYFLWKSVFAYTGAETIRGFAFNEMVQYYVLSMLVGFFTWSEVDKWMENDLVHGWIVKGMLKPVGLIPWYLSFEIGINAYNIVTQMIPVFLIGVVFFGLHIAPVLPFLGFLLSIVFAFLIYFGMAFLLGLGSFWMKRIYGLRRVRRMVVAFLGGSFIPIAFFPQSVQAASHFLPFQYARSVPILIYLQRAPLAESLLAQLAWVVVLYTIIYFVSKKAARRYVSVGL
ncbi:MAG: ABC-2 family transporter protein [Candidatus Woesearchaeota archaeon]